MNMQPLNRAPRIPKVPAPPPSPPPPPAIPLPGDLMRVTRVAAVLNLSRNRVYKMVVEGKLHAIRLGPRSMRILKPSVEACVRRALEQQEQTEGA